MQQGTYAATEQGTDAAPREKIATASSPLHTDRVRRGLIGDLHGARRRVLLALSSFTLALPVDGLRQPIREFRGGQGQLHGQSISDETVG